MSPGTILLITLTLLLTGGPPVFPHSRNWGCGPSGTVGTLLVVLLVLLLLGMIQDPIGNAIAAVRRRDGYRRVTPPALSAMRGGFPTFASPSRRDIGG